MKVALGTFACLAIESRLHCDPATGALEAVRSYARRLRDGEAPTLLPRFLVVPPGGVETTSFALALDPGLQAVLEAEADRQAVDVGQLLSHAVLLHLAELDAGLKLGARLRA